jgi:hypothetical protein
MSGPTRRAVWRALLLAVPALRVARADDAVHGADAIYLGPTVRIGWAVLRGKTADDATVVLRVVNVGGDYAFVRLDGSNPFNQEQRTVLVAAEALGKSVDLSMPRARFAELPSCEVRLYKDRDALQADRPALKVFYLGVPDTTPEFPTAAAAGAYLDHMLAQPKTKP